jgi:hypothetical protein
MYQNSKRAAINPVLLHVAAAGVAEELEAVKKSLICAFNFCCTGLLWGHSTSAITPSADAFKASESAALHLRKWPVVTCWECTKLLLWL